MGKPFSSAAVVLVLLTASVFTSASPALAARKARDVANCTGDPTGAYFASQVKFITSSFDPTNPSGLNGAPPTGSPNLTPSAIQAILQNFQTAFSIAPKSFQNLLCRYDGIYVDMNTDNNSWGYRYDGTYNNRYLALSYSLFKTFNSSAEAFSNFSTDRINQILGFPYGGPLYFGPAMHHQTTMEGPEITVLASLAHEAGHIVWYDAMKPNGMYGYSFCNGKFLDDWQTWVAPTPWVDLGDIDPDHNEHVSDPKTDDVSVSSIADALGDPSQLQPILSLLYDSNKSRWATPLGAFSPEEDFVETFENVILTYPGTSYALTSQPLYAYGVATPIGDTFSDKAYYKRKKHCFDDF